MRGLIQSPSNSESILMSMGGSGWLQTALPVNTVKTPNEKKKKEVHLIRRLPETLRTNAHYHNKTLYIVFSSRFSPTACLKHLVQSLYKKLWEIIHPWLTSKQSCTLGTYHNTSSTWLIVLRFTSEIFQHRFIKAKNKFWFG